MKDIIDRIKQIGYSYREAIIIPFAGEVYPETKKEFEEMLINIADVQILKNNNKHTIVITPIKQ